MNVPELFMKIGEHLPNKDVLAFRLINKNIKKYLENNFQNLSFSDRLYLYDWYVKDENFILFSKNSGIRIKKIKFYHNKYLTEDIFQYLDKLEYLSLYNSTNERHFVLLLHYIPNINIIHIKCCWKGYRIYSIDRLNKIINKEESICFCHTIFYDKLLKDIFIKTT